MEICTSPNPNIRKLSLHINKRSREPSGDVSDALIGYDKFHQFRLRQQDTVADYRKRFASPLSATREERQRTWRSGTARDRFTPQNLRWRAYEVTNFIAWSNCIGHLGEGGSSDPVETSSLSRAGEKIFVDWAGATVPISDRETAEVRQPSLFVAVTGASSYTFAHATLSQDLPNTALEKHIKPAAIRAGITKRIGWHTLRHSFGTLLKENGADLKRIRA